jgi:hypothetical protein
MATDGLTFLVWPLIVAILGVALVSANKPPSTKDLSTHSHRQLIGYAGLVLPLALPLIAQLRPTQGLDFAALDSVSSYYYTGAVAFFAGALLALAAFLFTYRGYKNRYNVYDRIAGFVAGGAAIGVAVFPTQAPNLSLAPSWWVPLTGRIHYGSAVVLFLAFACFALFLFPRTDPDRPRPGKEHPLPPDKRWRNRFYILCGLIMVACLIWALIAKNNDRSIYWPETIALVAFALSWLVKGRFEWTLVSAGQSAWRYARHPGQLADRIRSFKAG